MMQSLPLSAFYACQFFRMGPPPYRYRRQTAQLAACPARCIVRHDHDLDKMAYMQAVRGRVKTNVKCYFIIVQQIL